jgi:glycosyltransferase involved in cell wall biosynthesis
LLEACRHLSAQGVPFEAHIVGKFASEALRVAATDFVERHGLRRHVRFPGVLVAGEKSQAYRSADIFCFPSFYASETFGVVLIEAMSHGLPIVATNWRGIPSVVEDGVCGVLVPPRDAAALAARLRQLIENPSQREAMGAQGRRIFLQKFTSERCYRRLGEALTSL